MENDSPLAASRRVKENRWHNNKVEIAPPVAPPLPGQKAREEAKSVELEQNDDIKGFLKEEGQAAEGVRRVIMAVRQKRRTLQNEWDVREAVAKFVKSYAYAVPHADKEYLRGMRLALGVYLGQKEEI